MEKIFVGHLKQGDTVIIKEYQARQWYKRECLIESIEWCPDDEFDSAILELTFPCGKVKKQSWYTTETIRRVNKG